MIKVQNLFTGEVKKLYGVWPIKNRSDIITSLEHPAPPETENLLEFIGTDEHRFNNFRVSYPFKFIPPNRKEY